MRASSATFYRCGSWILAAIFFVELLIYALLDRASIKQTPSSEAIAHQTALPIQRNAVMLDSPETLPNTEKSKWQNPTIRAFFHLKQTSGLHTFVPGFKPTEIAISDELASILDLTDEQRVAVDKRIIQTRASALSYIKRYATNEVLEDGSILAVYDPPQTIEVSLQENFWQNIQALIGEEKRSFFHYAVENFNQSPDPLVGFAETPLSAIFNVSKSSDSSQNKYVIHVERGSLENPNFSFTSQGGDFDPYWMGNEELLAMLSPELRHRFLSQLKGSPAP